MSNDRLIKGVRAEIASHRLKMNQFKADASGGLLDDGTEVAVSQVLVGCRHILDRAMNVVWASYNSKKLMSTFRAAILPRNLLIICRGRSVATCRRTIQTSSR